MFIRCEAVQIRIHLFLSNRTRQNRSRSCYLEFVMAFLMLFPVNVNILHLPNPISLGICPSVDFRDIDSCSPDDMLDMV